MSYVVIARRWRPQQFEEIIAQDHVSRTLSNAIVNNRIAHSYIFTGPRGVGKTTTARILAKALNCEKGPTATPCNECSACESITRGNSMDVLEIDGASNRGIDEIRNLRENVRYTPTQGKYRIYIIDEVHMLTKEAFNALLKTLEEPPEHALFIFATTEIHKVPATILSRCQRFDFRRIPIKTIMEHLRHICTEDKISIEEEALLQIAKKADGSMRDSQSILDQIISFSGSEIKFEDVAQALGVIHQDIFFRITDLVKDRDLKGLILLAAEIFESGYDLNELLLGLEDHFRNILVMHSTGKSELIEASENFLELYKQAATKFTENDLINYLQIIGDTALAVRNSQQPNLKFELGLLKLAKMPSSVEVSDVLEKLDLLKKKAPEQSLTPGAAAPQPPVGPITKERILDIWPHFVQTIHEKRPLIANVLGKTRVTSFENDAVCLLTKNDLSLLTNNMTTLERALSQILKHKVKIKVEAEKKGKSAAKKALKSETSKKEIVDKLRAESKIISKLIDEFDLELL